NATLYATITNVNTVDTIVYGLTNEQLYYFAVTYTSSSGLEFKDIYKYEAEYGNFIGNAYMTNIASNYSGRGYVAGLDNNAGTVAINVICGADNTGSYILGIIGSVGSATNKSIKVRVNSSASDTTLTTTNYNNWDTAYITATLNEGVNTITISAIDGNDTPNIDAVVLTSTGRPQATPTGVYAFAISAETEVIKNDTFNFVIQALDERSETLTSFVGTVILYDTKNILSPDSTTAINITTNGNTTVICSLSELGFDTIIVWNAAFGVAAQFVIEVIEATFYDTSVVINEIMFDPPVAIGNPDGDWLELYNYSNSAVNIGGWYIDSYKYGKTASVTSGITIPSKGYVILCRNSAKFAEYNYNVNGAEIIQIANLNLDNESDTITLHRSARYKQSTVYYQRSFGANTENSGKSLEAYNPIKTAYGASPAQYNANFDTTLTTNGTPGVANSIAINTYTLIVKMSTILANTTAITDTSLGDTIAEIKLIMTLGNGDPIKNYGVQLTTTRGFFTNSTGGASTGSTTTVTTNDTGLATAYLVSNETGIAIITAACTQAGYNIASSDTHQIEIEQFRGIKFGFDTIFTFTVSALSDSKNMILFPVLSSDGKYTAYLGKHNSDSFGVYVMNNTTGGT
ncbi:MAG TPA: lamin tail domain-containing protein, partial [bacterium]|nr:lamin tail domain-containing protein [bacterium]